MTSERIVSMMRDVETCIKHRGIDAYVASGDAMCTYSELQWLLTKVKLFREMQGKTCEWRQNTICKRTVNVDGFRTSCGISNSETHPSTFCADCGGRVVIRNGGT